MTDTLLEHLESFQSTLRTMRGARTQREAAEKIGCPLRTYEDWEAGRRVPKRWVQKWILKALNGAGRQ